MPEDGVIDSQAAAADREQGWLIFDVVTDWIDRIVDRVSFAAINDDWLWLRATATGTSAAPPS